MTGPRRFVGAILAAAALAGFAAGSATAAAPASDPAAARLEVRFMATMIDHHAMAIRMAELCPGERSTSGPSTCARASSPCSPARFRRCSRGSAAGTASATRPAVRPGNERMLNERPRWRVPRLHRQDRHVRRGGAAPPRLSAARRPRGSPARSVSPTPQAGASSAKASASAVAGDRRGRRRRSPASRHPVVVPPRVRIEDAVRTCPGLLATGGWGLWMRSSSLHGQQDRKPKCQHDQRQQQLHRAGVL